MPRPARGAPVWPHRHSPPPPPRRGPVPVPVPQPVRPDGAAGWMRWGRYRRRGKPRRGRRAGPGGALLTTAPPLPTPATPERGRTPVGPGHPPLPHPGTHTWTPALPPRQVPVGSAAGSRLCSGAGPVPVRPSRPPVPVPVPVRCRCVFPEQRAARRLPEPRRQHLHNPALPSPKDLHRAAGLTRHWW